MQAWKLEDWLKHHGVKGQKWGVRRGPPYPIKSSVRSYKDKPPIKEVLERSRNHGTTRDEDFVIPRSLGAKAKNYMVFDPLSGDYFYFVEGTKIRNPKVFAGKGGVKKLNMEVMIGLSEQLGGEPTEWQHCKGIGTLDFYGEERDAEVHWFQEPSAGKHKFRVKNWLD